MTSESRNGMVLYLHQPRLQQMYGCRVLRPAENEVAAQFGVAVADLVDDRWLERNYDLQFAYHAGDDVAVICDPQPGSRPPMIAGVPLGVSLGEMVSAMYQSGNIVPLELHVLIGGVWEYWGPSYPKQWDYQRLNEARSVDMLCGGYNREGYAVDGGVQLQLYADGVAFANSPSAAFWGLTALVDGLRNIRSSRPGNTQA